jgi:hypothetical protein
MSLVSKTMRTFTIEHLFAAIHFECVQDLTWWGTMLERTPSLQHIVKRVKFSDPTSSVDGMKHYRKEWPIKPLGKAVVPPTIPIMPNVSIVEWEPEAYTIDDSMAIAYMALFPNTTELYISFMSFDDLSGRPLVDGFHRLARFLHASGKLRVLSLGNISVGRKRHLELPTFDLTALEDLRVIECADVFDDESGFDGPDPDFLAQLVEASRLTELKSLKSVTFAGGFVLRSEPCSLQVMQKILFSTNLYLTNLSLIVDSLVWGE